MSEQPILKPCPFCGSRNVQLGGDDKVVAVWCHDCQASGPNGYLTINGSFDWNDRPNSYDYDPTALQFITRIRDALGPDCHKLMIDELPGYIRSIAEKAKANE